MLDISNIRFLAESHRTVRDSTIRTLSSALLNAADHLELLKNQRRDAMALIGKLSSELNSVSKENSRLISALHETIVGSKRKIGL